MASLSYFSIWMCGSFIFTATLTIDCLGQPDPWTLKSLQPPRAKVATKSAEPKITLRVMPILDPGPISPSRGAYLGDSGRISKLSRSSTPTPMQIAESPILKT